MEGEKKKMEEKEGTIKLEYYPHGNLFMVSS